MRKGRGSKRLLLLRLLFVALEVQSFSGCSPVLLCQDADAIYADAVGDVNHVGDLLELQFLCAIHKKNAIRTYRE
jgi:hypothetical protein